MLFFTSVKVTSFDLDNFVVTWTVDLKPPTEAITNYRFYVQRSNAQEGPFDELNTASPLIDTFTFTDTQIDRLSKWRRFFYRIRSVDISQVPNVEVISTPAEFVVPTLTMQKRVQLEIIRTEKVLLQGVGVTPGVVGVKSLVFNRRTFGQRCVECWDPIKKKVSISQCDTCFGVGFQNGYHTPIVTHINYSPPAENTELTAIGEQQPNTIKAWMSNYPLVTEGDIIVDSSNVRFRVVNQTRSEALRNITRQALILYHVAPGDVEYKIALDTSLLDI